jgi:hypothetical protein
MNKIIEKLLTVTFPNVEIANLLEIVSATPNPELATEILCGLYVAPVLPEKVKENSGENPKTMTFKSYDKWRDRVDYTYIREKTIDGYFPKGTDRNTITLENIKELRQEWRSGQDMMNIVLKTGETVVDNSYCSLSTWLNYSVVKEENEL